MFFEEKRYLSIFFFSSYCTSHFVVVVVVAAAANVSADSYPRTQHFIGTLFQYQPLALFVVSMREICPKLPSTPVTFSQKLQTVHYYYTVWNITMARLRLSGDSGKRGKL